MKKVNYNYLSQPLLYELSSKSTNGWQLVLIKHFGHTLGQLEEKLLAHIISHPETMP